jgi:hypothetical protein
VAGVGYLGQAVVQAAVLPARAAYLIADGSEVGLRRAIREASARWGGMTEPIVPVKTGGEIDGWWRQVVTLAGADTAVNVDVAEADASAAAGGLGLELIPVGQVGTAGISMYAVHAAWAGPVSLPDPNAFVIGRENGPLWEITAAGDLSPEHLAGLRTDALWVRRAAEDEVARSQLWGHTLIERTVSQFSEHWARGGPSACPAMVWITEPDSVADCVYFWNLRALRPLRLRTVPMLLIPAGQVQYWLGFADQLAHVLERPDEFAPDAAIRSLSVGEDRLGEDAAQLGLDLFEGEPWSGLRDPAPLRQPPFTYRADLEVRVWFRFERHYGEVTDVDVHLLRDRTTIRFTSPVTFRGGGMTLVRLSGPPFDPLPKRQAVASRILNGASWSHDSLQVMTFAQNDYWFELHIPELREAADAVLGEVTVRHELSDKGKLGMAWLEGRDVSPLLEPGVFATIRALTTPRSKELLRELRRLKADGSVDDELAEVAAHWGGRVERRYRDASQVEGLPPSDATRILERLCALGWAERGLRISCGACGLAGFVGMHATTGHATCPGCSAPASYAVGSSLTVYYRLDSYLDRLSDQGVLPHLLTVAALARRAKASFFLPGTNLWFGSGERPDAEADVFGILDGKVLTGEVKTSAAEFTEEQITRDTDLSRKLAVDTHILAATDDIPDGVIGMAQTACTARGLALITLQRADLLPA